MDEKLTIRQVIGIEIKEARLAKKIDLKTFAIMMRATPQYMARVEAGAGSLSFDQLQKIVDLLNCEIKIKITRKYSKQTTNDQDAEICAVPQSGGTSLTSNPINQEPLLHRPSLEI